MSRQGIKCTLNNLRDTYNLLAAGDRLPLHNQLIAMESVRSCIEKYEDLAMEAE